MAVLAIYTDSFPYGSAETFLETEIRYLSAEFEKIYIIPGNRRGTARPLPANTEVRVPLRVNKWTAAEIYLAGLKGFYKLFTVPGLKITGLLKSLRYLGFGLLVKKNISPLVPEEAGLHYSYWLDYSAFALSMLKQEGRIKKFVARAHGFDLYEERGEKGLAFVRPAVVRAADRVYLISEHGKSYLSGKFPELSGKFFLSRLGIDDPGASSPAGNEETFNLLSCSAVNPNKRVELIPEALHKLITAHPEKKIRWQHIGGGKGLEELKTRTEELLRGSSVSVHFTGQLSSSEIRELYLSRPADLSITLA